MPTTVTSKRGDEVRVGDVLTGIVGPDRTITRIEPYPGAIFPAGTARLAFSGDLWAITLPNEQRFEVAPCRP
jgi:hypothetical protein